MLEGLMKLHTASRSSSGVSGLQRLFVTSLAEIISSGVDDNGALRNVSLHPSLRIEEHTPMTLSAPINLMSLSVVVPLPLP
jgi:hypothetical protein